VLGLMSNERGCEREGKRRNPAVLSSQRETELIIRLGSRFCLTPADRVTLSIKRDDDDDLTALIMNPSARRR
jgi:phage terminase small subunit